MLFLFGQIVNIEHLVFQYPMYIQGATLWLCSGDYNIINKFNPH